MDKPCNISLLVTDVIHSEWKNYYENLDTIYQSTFKVRKLFNLYRTSLIGVQVQFCVSSPNPKTIHFTLDIAQFGHKFWTWTSKEVLVYL